MIKAILFDVDGLIVKGRYAYFSDRFSNEYGVEKEKILTFFKNEYQLCRTGKADLKQEVQKYFPHWNWKGSIDEFLEYWFSQDIELNEELLVIVKRLRDLGIKCYLATNQEKYRMDYLWNKFKLSQYFDSYFSSCDLGYTKNEMQYFEKIISNIEKIGEKNMLMIDSDESILNTAKEAGLGILDHKDKNILKKLSEIANLSITKEY